MENIRIGEMVLAELLATVNGSVIDREYRAVLTDEDDVYAIGVQVLNEFTNEWQNVVEWDIETLTKDGISDFLYVDSGQAWGVHGMELVTRKAMHLLNTNRLMTI